MMGCSMKVLHALLSVEDPLAVEELARFLVDTQGTKLLATRRTAAQLRALGLPVTETSGLCSTGDAADPTLRAPTGEAIDVVAVELPAPLGRTPPREGFDLLAFEMDVVGPHIVRSAVACFERTCVVADPEDYRAIIAMLVEKGELDLPFQRLMARRAIAKLAAYEGPLTRELTSFDEAGFRQEVPEILVAGYRRLFRLADGAGAASPAWLYRADDELPGSLPTTLNYGPTGPLDVTRARDAALAMELLAEHFSPTAVLLARQKPLHVVSAATIAAAVAAIAERIPADLSGAVVAMNVGASAEVFGLLASAPVAVIAAPTVDPVAVERAAERRGVSLLATGGMIAPDARDISIVVIPGGLLVEARDTTCRGEVEAGAAAGRPCTESERRALVFAWAVAKYARSDAIVLARQDGASMRTVAIAAGEVSRRRAIERALDEAGTYAERAVLASDGPITEAGDLELIASAGVTAVAHPGGPADQLGIGDRDGELAIVATNVAHIRY
jgi:phosphoribosylaminoimidazolecarboxamide formyltransferase / IMP cyclohydrolase